MSPKPSHYINGKWIESGGSSLTSTNPAAGEENWRGRAATTSEIDRAIDSARAAFETFADVPLAERVRFLQTVADQLAGSGQLQLHRNRRKRASIAVGITGIEPPRPYHY